MIELAALPLSLLLHRQKVTTTTAAKIVQGRINVETSKGPASII
jgi:hypothetical protein